VNNNIDNNNPKINNYSEQQDINCNYSTYPSYYCPICNNYRDYPEPIGEYGYDDYESPYDYEYLDVDDDYDYRQGDYGRPRRRRRRRRRRRQQFPFIIFPFFFPFGGFDDDWDEY
jgi:hypothetical protein